jgi:hypothetical protein
MDVHETICKHCANFCHQSHTLVDYGYILGYCFCGYGCSRCHCFLENPVEGDLDIPPDESRQCGFRATGREYTEMDGFHCSDCHLIRSEFCCTACSKLCHRRHHIEGPIHSRSAYCHCGDQSTDYHCLLSPPETIPSPLKLCTIHATGEKMISKQLYRCKTCNFGETNCVCKSCADVCHEGHLMEEIDQSSSGFCDCGAGILDLPCKLKDLIEPAA